MENSMRLAKKRLNTHVDDSHEKKLEMQLIINATVGNVTIPISLFFSVSFDGADYASVINEWTRQISHAVETAIADAIKLYHISNLEYTHREESITHREMSNRVSNEEYIRRESDDGTVPNGGMVVKERSGKFNKNLSSFFGNEYLSECKEEHKSESKEFSHADYKEEKQHIRYDILNKSWGQEGGEYSRGDKRQKLDRDLRTALIVDDVEMCRKACGNMMQEIGFKVEFAHNGKEAVDKILRENSITGEVEMKLYSVVMMDNFMPVMDGCQAVSLLRLNGYEGAIVGLTYDIFDETSKEFREAGCAALLMKPLRLGLVQKALSKLNVDYYSEEK